MTATLNVYVVNFVDKFRGPKSMNVLATEPDEAMTIVERGGFDYDKAEVLLNGEQVATYDERAH
jgi:hypothetical protein